MKLALIILFLVFFSYALGVWFNKERANQLSQKPSSIYQPDCDLNKQPCQVEDGDFKYVLSFNGEPSALKPFTVELAVESPELDQVDVNFEMEGMDMGYNRYQLREINNTWQADVILPVCSVGRNDWILNLELNAKGRLHLAKFHFNQP